MKRLPKVFLLLLIGPLSFTILNIFSIIFLQFNPQIAIALLYPKSLELDSSYTLIERGLLNSYVVYSNNTCPTINSHYCQTIVCFKVTYGVPQIIGADEGDTQSLNNVDYKKCLIKNKWGEHTKDNATISESTELGYGYFCHNICEKLTEAYGKYTLRYDIGVLYLITPTRPIELAQIKDKN